MKLSLQVHLKGDSILEPIVVWHISARCLFNREASFLCREKTTKIKLAIVHLDLRSVNFVYLV